MANTVNINQNNNNVSLQDNNKQIIITDNNAGTTINVTQPVTSIVTISALGPQGAQGPAGTSVNTGSFVSTASFNAFTASYTTGSFTGSFTGTVTGTASFATTASYVSSNFQYEIHVSQVDGNDTTGNGDLLKPVATIGKALLLVSASVASTDRRTIIVHPGTYIENITINTTNTYFFSTGVLGANCLISGSVTISAATRMSGIKMTNLIVSSSNPIYINNCAVDKQMTVSGSGYLEVQNTSLQCTSGIQVVGPASTGVIFENCSLYPLTVNNASAAVYVISCNQAITPTLTAGALTITRSTISSLTSGATSTALTTAAGSVLVLESCNVYNSLLTSHAAITANGFYSIKNVIYNRSASTLASLSGTGGPLATVSQFQYINADNINSTQGLTVTGSITVSGSITGSLFGTSSFAVSSSRSISSSFATTSSFAVSASWAPTQTINTSSFVTTGSNTFTGSQTITGSNGRLIYTGTTPGIYPTLAEVHINNDYPWLHRFYNDTFSTSSAVMAYFGWNDGRFVFHNESTQSIGLQVNGYSAENGLLVYSDKVAFVNNVEVTGSLLVSGSITGSLFGTASWATNAITASYALNGGVTQLLAGPNVTLSPTNGLGQVTISSTSGGGGFNTATGSYGSFYSTQTQTNVAGTARSMSLNTTDITNGVSVSGSTNPFNTYIKTENAGVYDIQFSAQVDKTDSGTDEIWIWLRKNGTNLADTATSVQLTGNGAHYVAAWNFFVNAAANDYFQLMWYSPDANVRLHAEPAFGVVPGIPSLIVTANRVDQFLSNTGSFSGSFTGNLIGTATTASYISGSVFTSTNPALSASYAATSSYSNNFVIGSTLTLDSTLSDVSTVNSTIVGSNNLFQQATGSFTSAHGKYTAYKGANARAGEFVTSWNGTTTSYYDNSTVDIGNTTDITFQSSIVTSQIQINSTALSSGWTIKMLVTYL